MDVLKSFSPEAASATAVYAVGDIHGRHDLLVELEAAIDRDIAATGPRAPVVCYLGDYIDKGPASAQVIERLCRARDDGVARVYIKGNHEDRMLAFLREPDRVGPIWFKYGAREAFESYGVSPPHHCSDWGSLRDALHEAVPPPHMQFLQKLRLAFVWSGYVFVHAGLNPARPIDDQLPQDLVSIREEFVNSTRDWGTFRVVHGHVITSQPQFRSNRIGIDTGAYQSGV
jgi:serine/threonine protein phosphatase 1